MMVSLVIRMVASIVVKVLPTLTYNQLLQSTDRTEPRPSRQISRLIAQDQAETNFQSKRWIFLH